MSHVRHEPTRALTPDESEDRTDRNYDCGQGITYQDEDGNLRRKADGELVTIGEPWGPGCYCQQDVRTAAGEGWELTAAALHRSGYKTVRDVFRATRDSDAHILEVDRSVRREARKMIMSPKQIWLLVGRLMRREREFNEWRAKQ